MLRFFLDPGSGICLWAGDARTQERFGYAIGATDLGLPPDLAAELDSLIASYDAAFPWDDPGTRDEQRLARLAAEDAVFARRMDDLQARLQAALGPHFRIERR